jgi:hypothetical protein
MQLIKSLAFAALLAAATASAASADVSVTIANGRVSVVAKDATLRQILAEWARVGQTRIVNLERIAGGPITVELTNVPEAEALDILLRPVSGFMAAPRPVQTATLSRFDRIVVMPTIAAPRAPVTAAAAAAPQPAFTPPQPPPFPGDDEADPNGQVQRPPVFNTFPQPQVVYPGTNPTMSPQPGVNGNVPQQYGPNGQPIGGVPQQYGPNGQPIVQQPFVQQPTAAPSASPYGGVAVPGMIVAPPQQPGAVQPGVAQPGVVPPGIVQPGVVPPGVVQPGQPQPPPKRPGGQTA